MNEKFTMKTNGVFIFIATAVVVFSMSSSRTINAISFWERNHRNESEHDRPKRQTGVSDLECFHHNDCQYFEKCNSNKCIHACKPDPCGINAKCTEVINHYPLCECLRGYSGDPDFACSKKKCITNNDCLELDKCEDNYCTAACTPDLCGDNARCHVENHLPICACTEGYTGDPKIQCHIKYCKTNKDCEQSDKCYLNRCTAACPYYWCGDNGSCHVEDHLPVCTFTDLFVEYPEPEYKYVNCVTNDDCEQDEKCENKECIDVCESQQCEFNEMCQVKDHLPICILTNEFTDYSETEKQNCMNSNDCGEFEECKSNKCIDVCHPSPCGVNAWCARDQHNPVCFCNDEFNGDPYTECIKMECIINKHCKYFEECRDNKCSHACEPDPCGGNATCTSVYNHYPFCTCNPGFVGDPDIGCVQLSCNTSDDCDELDKCDNNWCTAACTSHLCGDNTRCHVENHQHVCVCREGYTGDPKMGCKTRYCKTSNDCEDYDRCLIGRCTAACPYPMCGDNASCHVEDHQPVCACIDGSIEPETGCNVVDFPSEPEFERK